jgi:tetratricopeptide (TPR) repeat protein
MLLLVTGASELAAQMGTGRVAGTVKDTEGNNVAGAKVMAEMTGTDFQLEATTDDKGRWAILGFRKGNYAFTFTAKGYVPQQFSTQVSGLGKNPNVNVVLEKMTSGQAFAAGEAADLMKAARDLYDANDFTGALAKYQEIITEYSDIYQINLYLGNCNRELGNLDEALENYNAVLAEEPLNTVALVNVGDVYVRKGDFESAVTYFEQALEQAPEDEVLPFNVAEIYFDQGDVAGAITYYKRAAEVKADWVEPQLKLGYAYINMADMENAAIHFKKVIEMAPDTPQAAVAQAALDSIQQ